MLEAKSLRVVCLCHMALSQIERAVEVLDIAEKVKNQMQAGQPMFARFRTRHLYFFLSTTRSQVTGHVDLAGEVSGRHSCASHILPVLAQHKHLPDFSR